LGIEALYVITIFVSFARMTTITTSKRKALTTDDLLRRQEEPQKWRRKLPVVQRDEDEDSSPGEDDDFDLASEDSEVGKDGNERESEIEESADSASGRENSPMQTSRIGRSTKGSSLLGSRVTVKPRLSHRHTPSPETGTSKNVTFSSLGVSPPLLSALSKMAIHAPTEVQQACIPPLLAGPFIPVAGIPDYR
jgi:ATP-dependent RNA helicase DDX49/DBP8